MFRVWASNKYICHNRAREIARDMSPLNARDAFYACFTLLRRIRIIIKVRFMALYMKHSFLHKQNPRVAINFTENFNSEPFSPSNSRIINVCFKGKSEPRSRFVLNVNELVCGFNSTPHAIQYTIQQQQTQLLAMKK